LQIFVDDFSKQFTQRYLHVYPEDPPYRYMSCEPGHGSYGTVTKVQSTLTNREFALKTFGKVFFPPDEERILDELAILEVCDHPNLLRLIDAYKIKDDRTKIHFVIEPWAPYTLDKFLYTTEDQRARECSWFKPGNRASTSVIFRVMHDLASGVRYLHERSIKHKDINPRNTLLYLEGSMEIRPILADVGKSKVHRKDGSTRYTDSTYEFLAPEQLDKLESTLQADIWQLGTCLAFLLVLACGGTAATHSVWHSVVNSADGRSCCIAMELDHFMAELEKFCDAQSKALGIVKRMLDKDPKSRSDIHEVLAALNNLVNVHDN
jgi:serine/threonine protein kinase